MCTRMSVCSYWVLELSEGVSLTWGGPGWGAWTAQHGPTAQPPAQPGSIWVASGRSAAEPAVAELGQDLFLFPCPACSLGAALRSIWATTWAVRHPVRGARGERVHTHRGGSRRALTQCLEGKPLHRWAASG